MQWRPFRETSTNLYEQASSVYIYPLFITYMYPGEDLLSGFGQGRVEPDVGWVRKWSCLKHLDITNDTFRRLMDWRHVSWASPVPISRKRRIQYTNGPIKKRGAALAAVAPRVWSSRLMKLI